MHAMHGQWGQQAGGDLGDRIHCFGQCGARRQVSMPGVIHEGEYAGQI